MTEDHHYEIRRLNDRTDYVVQKLEELRVELAYAIRRISDLEEKLEEMSK